MLSSPNLENSNLNAIHKDIAAMTPTQRYAFEQRLEDEYVSGELTWSSKKRDILHTWMDLLYYYVSPTKSVVSYIRNRLKLRGVPRSGLEYVTEVAVDDEHGNYAKYKDPDYDHSDSMKTTGKPVERASIFEDFEDLAKATLSPEELDRRSQAELFEIISKEVRFYKGLKTKITDRVELLRAIAKRHNVKISDFEKLSADIPPEHFHGQSEMYYSAEGFENEYLKMAKSWKDIKQMIYYFRPSPEVAKRSTQLYEQFKQSELLNLQAANMVLIKAYQNILTPISDAKWGTSLSGWFKIGRDQQVNYGSNGAGVKNSIPTGYYVTKEYRDGRKELITYDRPWTKEQVSDNMEEKLIKLALIQTTANKIEKANMNWINNTHLVEIMNEDGKQE